MLEDSQLTKAVASLRTRSEREQDPAKVIEKFVDIGLLNQLLNDNSQILYGRRGTGKTHVFKVLESSLAADSNNAVCYIDARTLGSSEQFSDPTLPIKQRCTSLFRDILGELSNALLEYLVASERMDAWEALTEIQNIATNPVTSEVPAEAETKLVDKSLQSSGFEVSLDAKGPKIASKINDSNEATIEQRGKITFRIEDKVVFHGLSTRLKDFIRIAKCNIYLLVDEWSSLPFEVQPYLAEFLKRSFMPIPQVTIKIAALEYRSNFGVQKDRDHLGFEVGSDIASSIDADDYYVFDRDPTGVTRTFAEILYRHLSADLGEEYVQNQLRISGPDQLPSRLFTSRNVFEELTRASEGVVRDLINIFVAAFFRAQQHKRNSIDQDAVRHAARQWFESDKAKNLDEGLQLALKGIISEVIGRRKARSFLLSKELEKHAIIQRLFDSRVLHLMVRGYSAKDRPGERYNIYSLDYGTYLDLINTIAQPEYKLEESSGSEVTDERLVPFDDHRSIRRIVLSRELLDHWLAQSAPAAGSSVAPSLIVQ